MNKAVFLAAIASLPILLISVSAASADCRECNSAVVIIDGQGVWSHRFYETPGWTACWDCHWEVAPYHCQDMHPDRCVVVDGIDRKLDDLFIAAQRADRKAFLSAAAQMGEGLVAQLDPTATRVTVRSCSGRILAVAVLGSGQVEPSHEGTRGG